MDYNKNFNYVRIDSIERLKDFADTFHSDLFAFDTETTGLSYFDLKIIGLSICNEDTCVYMQFNFTDTFFVKEKDPDNGRRKIWTSINFEKTDAIDIAKATPYLQKIFKEKKVICANGKFDIKVADKYSFNLFELVDDVNVMSYMYNSGSRNGLKENAKRYLSLDMQSYDDMAGVSNKIDGKLNINWTKVNWFKYAEYGAKDSYATWHLYKILETKLKNAGKAKTPEMSANPYKCYKGIELPLIPVIADMEMTGIKLKKDKMLSLSKKVEQKIKLLEEKIYNKAGIVFNPASTKQLAEVLFDRMKYPVVAKTKTGNRSTSVDVLKELSYKGYELPSYLLYYRKLKKLKSSFIDALPEKVDADGRLRGNFNQTGTVTGRLSSSNPNLQQIPAREKEFPIRQFFTHESDTVLVGGDYSQLELRVMAHMSKDVNLAKAYQNNEDIHQMTTDNINEKMGLHIGRSEGKRINFSVLYGMVGMTLANEMNTDLKEMVVAGELTEQKYKERKVTDRQGDMMVNGFYSTYIGFRRGADRNAKESAARKFAKTLAGRIRYIPELLERRTYQQGYRYATSTWIQGSAADIVKKAMIDVYNAFKKHNIKGKLILQVHDELIAEVKKSDAKRAKVVMQEAMENVWSDFIVPLKCDVGIYNTWADLKYEKEYDFQSEDDLILEII